MFAQVYSHLVETFKHSLSNMYPQIKRQHAEVVFHEKER